MQTAETDPGNEPIEDAAAALLRAIAPGSLLSALRPLAGDHFNDTFLVEAHSGDGPLRVVVKRYIECGNDLAAKARVEYQTLAWLERQSIPAPRPLYLDESGSFFGAPVLVTAFVPGERISTDAEHPDPRLWVDEMGCTLAKIHALPCDGEAQAFLAPSDFLWFLRSGSIPDYMRNHRDGAAVWQAIHELRPNLAPARRAFVHTDYWPGNVLWVQGRIAAVLDWEEATCEDPAADVAYCRMDMVLNGREEAAADFLRSYERATGSRVANLAFWELAASVRPMYSPEGWISQSPSRERFREFVANALRRCVTPPGRTARTPLGIQEIVGHPQPSRYGRALRRYNTATTANAYGAFFLTSYQRSRSAPFRSRTGQVITCRV